MNFGTMIKRLQDIMRQDAGVNGDAQRIEQIVWMLFLKLYDAKEEEWEIEEDNYKSIIPEEYRWRNWAIDNKDGKAMTGDSLSTFVINLFNTLKDLPITEDTDVRGRIVKEIFEDLNNYMKDGVLIRQVVNVLNEIDLTDFQTRHAFNEIYETILKDLQSAGKSGEFYTPRAITEFVVQMVDPKVGQSVADFACGTGGFLVSALNHMKKDITDTKQNEILSKSFYGVEKKPLPYLLCTTNMLLHDINEPMIIHGNSLEKNVRDYEEDDKFDIILMNPPYGGTEKKSVQQNFPEQLRNSETADLFMVEILYRLKENGKVGIVLPDGFLFGNDNTKVNIKKKLLEECNLHTIIRLPGSIFAPYTPIATNLLFFDKTGSTSEVWFYRMDLPKGYKAFSKTKPVEIKHMQSIIEWWNNRIEIEDQKKNESMSVTWKAKKYTIDEIKELNYNLDQCGYPVEEEVILSPKETMDNFIERREKLEKQLDEKLEKIIKLVGDIK
ncbi:MAG: N-6 DNA methylase [Erysipelotrichaceae bacterium]